MENIDNDKTKKCERLDKLDYYELTLMVQDDVFVLKKRLC